MTIVTPSILSMPHASGCKYRPIGNAHSVCSLKPTAAVPCDFTSSDDDEHNTDNNFLLLFADVGITPTLLEGLTEVDVPHIALGCRFALDIFTISQQYSPTPDHEPLPHDPELSSILSTGSTQALRLSRRPTGSDHVHFCFLHNACT